MLCFVVDFKFCTSLYDAAAVVLTTSTGTVVLVLVLGTEVLVLVLVLETWVLVLVLVLETQVLVCTGTRMTEYWLQL